MILNSLWFIISELIWPSRYLDRKFKFLIYKEIFVFITKTN